MKSVFEGLREDYIKPEWKSCPIPGRPWWKAVDERGIFWKEPFGPYIREPRCMRTFMKVSRWDGSPQFSALGENESEVCAEVEQKCAEYDALHPLPHPGYRVGQIWAVEIDDQTHVMDPLTAQSFALYEIYSANKGPDYIFYHASKIVRRDKNTGVLYGDAVDVDKLKSLTLLYDPIRPDLAPWTGVVRVT